MLNHFLDRPFVFLDGAMGTLLQRAGLKAGEHTELVCLSNGDQIQQVHRAYLESGSDIIYTNTLCANRFHLKGTGVEPRAVIERAVQLAKEAAEGYDALVALDIGSLGVLLEPAGTLSFEEAYACFREQVIAGESAGCDLILFETMADLYEVKAAVLAAKENTKLPVFVTMTFEENGRTFMGCDVQSMACLLEGLGVDAMGINCSLGPEEILPIARTLSENTRLPLIIKANAGLPDPVTGEFPVGADLFARQMAQYAALGVRYIGGCCGTDPEYIRKLKKTFEGLHPAERSITPCTMVCTPTKTVSFDHVLLIGENINPTGKKRLKRAIGEGDLGYIAGQGLAQAEAGAEILDVNVGLPGINEQAWMVQVVRELQSVTALPLQIDSANPDVLEAALRIYNGKPIVNSVNGKQESMDRVFPIVKKYGAAVIGLLLDEKGIPATAEGRVAIAEKICREATRHGILPENVLLDPLVLTASAQQEGALVTLDALRLIRERLGCKTVLGLSNISYGLPNRDLINQSFLTLALAAGLDAPIVNPMAPGIRDALAAYHVLSGTDKGSVEYIRRYAGTPATESKPVLSTADPENLKKSVLSGTREEAKKTTARLLGEMDEMRIVDEILIPVLDEVGQLYERGDYFLPQLLRSAEAACDAFDLIKASIHEKGAGTVSKGKILLATVEGDIHDIGKNIVRVLLENYGYTVLDLGKDVPIHTIVQTVLNEEIPLVGLSALMTTTADNIRRTIEALRQSGAACTIMVGGAVLTEDYARQMGADFYARDAKAGVDIARKVFH